MAEYLPILIVGAIIGTFTTLFLVAWSILKRKKEDMTPVYLEDTEFSKKEYSLILQVLEKKGLISIDYDKPLSGADMTAYKDYPVWGSMALTARGQTVLELLETQGIGDEI